MSELVDRLNEGGPFFMYPILIILIIIITLTIKGVLQRKQDNTKTIALLSSIGFFVVAWGILGQTIGLIGAFDSIQAVGDISMEVLAGGLKVSLLTTVFGILTFLFSRAGIIILTILKK